MRVALLIFISILVGVVAAIWLVVLLAEQGWIS